MKKILITGAFGNIGTKLLDLLIEDGSYEITAFDLKKPHNYKKNSNKYYGINVVFGDINDQNLINSLILNKDIIIHLAGVLPPFAEMHNNLIKMVDYDGTKNLIKAITTLNPKAFLIYSSTTSLYGNDKKTKITVKNDVIVDADNNYAMSKLRAEEKIIGELKNYTIFRLPIVCGNLKENAPMYHIPNDANIEIITLNDAARAFYKALEYTKKLNKKIFNVTGGKECRSTFKEYMYNIIKYYGISFRYLGTMILIDKNFYSGHYDDSDKLNGIIDYQTETIKDYFERIKLTKRKRILIRLLSLPFILKYKIRK